MPGAVSGATRIVVPMVGASALFTHLLQEAETESKADTDRRQMRGRTDGQMLTILDTLADGPMRRKIHTCGHRYR